MEFQRALSTNRDRIPFFVETVQEVPKWTGATLKVVAIVAKVGSMVSQQGLGNFSCFLTFIAHRYSFIACHASLGRRYEVGFTNTLIPFCSRVELSDATSSALARALVINDKILFTALSALGTA